MREYFPYELIFFFLGPTVGHICACPDINICGRMIRDLLTFSLFLFPLFGCLDKFMMRRVVFHPSSSSYHSPIISLSAGRIKTMHKKVCLVWPIYYEKMCLIKMFYDDEDTGRKSKPDWSEDTWHFYCSIFFTVCFFVYENDLANLGDLAQQWIWPFPRESWSCNQALNFMSLHN